MPFMSIPIALAIGAAGSAASSIYSAKRAGDTNNRALAAQERDAARQAQLDERRIAIDQQRWNDYVRIHEPIWNIGGGALRNLAGMAGVPMASSGRGPTAAPAMPSGGPGPGTMPPAAGAGRAAPSVPNLMPLAAIANMATPPQAGAPPARRRYAAVTPRVARGNANLTDLAMVGMPTAGV